MCVIRDNNDQQKKVKEEKCPDEKVQICEQIKKKIKSYRRGSDEGIYTTHRGQGSFVVTRVKVAHIGERGASESK